MPAPSTPTTYSFSADGRVTVSVDDMAQVLRTQFDPVLKTLEGFQTEMGRYTKQLAANNERLSRYLDNSHQAAKEAATTQRLLEKQRISEQTPVRRSPAPYERPIPGGPDDSGPADWQARWNSVKGMKTTGDAFDFAREGFAKFIQNRTPISPERDLERDARGLWHIARGQPGAGQFVSPEEEQAYKNYLWKMQLGGMAKSLLRAQNSGEAIGAIGQMGKMGGSLAKGATAAYAVYRGADMAREFATEQIQANAPWRQMTGGSELDAFKDRFGQGLFALNAKWNPWSHSFGMGDQQARQLYEGSRALGLDGNGRAAMNFGSDMWGAHRLSVADSLKLVQITTRAGVSSLSDLSEAIGSVAETAKEGGLNVKEATERFQATFKSLTSTMTGDAAAVVAATDTNLASMVGFRGEKIGSLSSDQTGRLAASLGMTRARYNATVASGGPEGAMLDARAKESLIKRYGPGLLGDDRMRRLGAWAQRWAAENGTSVDALVDPATPQHVKDAFQRAATEQFGVEGLDVESMSQMWNSAIPGRTTDMTNVASTVLTDVVLAGSGTLSRQTRDTIGATSEMNVNLGNKTVAELGGDFNSMYVAQNLPPQLLRALRDNGPEGKAVKDFLEALDVKPTEEGIRDLFTWKYPSWPKWKRAALDMLLSTGRVSPMITRFIKSGDTGGKFLVSANGERRQVNLEELLTYFPDQASYGAVQIVEGDDKGGTIATVANLGYDTNVTVSSSTQAKINGKTAVDIGKEYEGDDGEGSSSRVVIDASPWLKQFFSFQTGQSSIEPGDPYATPSPTR